MAIEFVPEGQCPVDVASARTELDLDPFGAPIDARTYVDYKNVSNRPIAAVKFRIRFYDAEGKDRGTFHAPDARLVEPGGQGSQKWKTERVDPRIVTVKMRALEVRFADGSSWQSAKLPELVQPAGVDGGGAFPGSSLRAAGGAAGLTAPTINSGTPGPAATGGTSLPGATPNQWRLRDHHLPAATGGTSLPGATGSSPGVSTGQAASQSAGTADSPPPSSSGSTPAPAAAEDPFGGGGQPPDGDKQ